MFEGPRQRTTQDAQQAQQAQPVQQADTGDVEAGKPAGSSLTGRQVGGNLGALGAPPAAGGSPNGKKAAYPDSPRSQQALGSPRSQQAPSSPRLQLSPAEAAALHARLERLSLSRLTSTRLSLWREQTLPMFCMELAVRSFAWSKYAYRHWVRRPGRELISCCETLSCVACVTCVACVACDAAPLAGPSGGSQVLPHTAISQLRASCGDASCTTQPSPHPAPLPSQPDSAGGMCQEEVQALFGLSGFAALRSPQVWQIWCTRQGRTGGLACLPATHSGGWAASHWLACQARQPSCDDAGQSCCVRLERWPACLHLLLD